MNALASRNDAQHALTHPTTIQDLGRRVTAESKAMRALLDVAENEVRWHGGSAELRAAVIAVKEAQR